MPKRPINADVPEPQERQTGEPQEEKLLRGEEKPPRGAAGAPPSPPKPRQPKPLAPKLLIALAALAVVFIVVAIVGGSGGGEEGDGGSTVQAPSSSGGEAQAPAVAEALAFPTFATSNTTRISGSSPPSNAAGVALAVFPSVTEAQRPAAVTLAAEEDWAGAIAASVLMAPPVRSPLLFTGRDELPEDSAEAFAALAPQGGDATGGASVFAIGSVALPDDAGEVTRVDSGDPAATAAQIASLRERLAGRPPAHFLVASSSSPDFAMPAAAWAARSGDPVLYAGEGKLPPPTAAALKRHPKVPVYVLGPTAAISAAAFEEIEKLGGRVRRVAGKDPVGGALALARYRDGSFGWDINDPGHGFVLARSDSPADAAAAAALSASGTWGPLLLSDDPDTLPSALRSYFLDVKPGYTTDPTRAFYNRVWVIGDPEAIGVAQQAEVNELAELAKIGGEPEP